VADSYSAIDAGDARLHHGSWIMDHGSWIMWQRWHRAARLRGRLAPGSWFKCALASTTRGMCGLGGAMPANTSWVRERSARSCMVRPRLPRPSRQAPTSSSHQVPSPRWITSRPWGRWQCSHLPFARGKRISWDNSAQSIGYSHRCSVAIGIKII